MGIDPRAAWALRDALSAKGRTEAGRTDAAEVTRIDEEGTVWVHIAGGVEETPVNGTLAASVGVGDAVTVSIENGRLSVLGNSTAPSVGQTYVEQSVAPAVTAATAAQTSSDIARKASERAVAEASTAHAAAEYAVGKAEDAAEAAEDAQGSADAAQASADAAQGSADAALASAGRAEQGAQYAREYAEEALGKSAEATEAANAATTSLSVVQDVIGTLEWISEHGTYTLTTDTTVDPTKVYFTRSGTDPDYTYTPVAEPKDEELSTYYELSMDEAMAEFVGAHLALLSDGLHVVSDTSGYYIVLGNDAMRVYDPNGVMVGEFGSSVILRESAGKDVTISPSWLRLRFGAMHLGVTHVGTQFEVTSSGIRLTKSNAWSSLEPFHVQTVNMPDEYKSGGAHYDEDAAQYLVTIGLARSGIEFAECDYQLSLGDENTIEALDAVAIGNNLYVASRGQVVAGRYNVADAAGKYVLIIGNGTRDSNRSNAFTVDWNGDAEAAGDLIAGGDVSDATGTLDQVRQDSKNADNITSGTLPIARGGTGATTASDAVQALTGRAWDYNTNNTTDTWVPVSTTVNGEARWQHRSIPTNLATTPTSLWSGDSNGNLTLSQSAANFTRITIYYRDNDSQYGSTDVYAPNGKTAYLATSWHAYDHKMRTVKFNGTSLTTVNAWHWQGKGNVSEQSNLIYIIRVLGWKY